MSLLIQPTKEPSNLPSLPIIPLWMKHFTEREAVNHYHREGVSNLVIAREPIRISQDDYLHAKQLLKELKQIYSIKVSLNLISDIFKVVNALVSNPVSKDDFNFKMKAIYSAFRDYPAAVFNLETCRKLGTTTRFFPSAYEIQAIIGEVKKDLEDQIVNLQAVVDAGYCSPVDEQEIQSVKTAWYAEEKQRHKEEQERRMIDRWKNLFLPFDPLYERFKSLVGEYLTGKYPEKRGKALIAAMEEELPIITNPEVKTIFESELENIRKAQAMLEQLEKFGMDTSKPFKAAQKVR